MCIFYNFCLFFRNESITFARTFAQIGRSVYLRRGGRQTKQQMSDYYI